MTLGALEPKFWQAWCRGVGREDLIEKQFEAPGSETHAEVERIFLERTRDEWQAFASEHDCCLEPVLDLDEALDSELVRAREMVVELDQPGAGKVKQLGVPVKLSRTPGGARAPGPVLGEHTDEVLAAAGYSEEEIGALKESGAVAGPAAEVRARSWHESVMATPDGLLKMSELAERSGVSAGTIKHYLREGLLPEPVKTSRNMAYYPPEFIERIRLIKRLQEQRFMPLRLIKGVIEEDPDRARAMVELEDRILERAAAASERGRASRAEVRRRYEIPVTVLDRLEELRVLTPNSRGYDDDDVAIIEAISRFRAGGYDEQLGFTVYDTLRYREALEPLVAEEVRTLLDRLVGQVDADRAVEIISAGAEPLRELIGAMHSKLLLAELHRQRGDA